MHIYVAMYCNVLQRNALQCIALCFRSTSYTYIWWWEVQPIPIGVTFSNAVSKLKARMSVFTEVWQKRRSSFELWAFVNVTPSGIGCTSTEVHRIHIYVAMYCNVLQRNVLQCIALCFRSRSYTYTCWWEVHRIHIYVAMYCNVLQRNVLRCIAVYCTVLQRIALCVRVLQCIAVYCSVLQCVTSIVCYICIPIKTAGQWGVIRSRSSLGMKK